MREVEETAERYLAEHTRSSPLLDDVATGENTLSATQRQQEG